MSPFHDHFSGHASTYARARPSYPEDLYRWLAEVAPGRALAVDVGCGNGQATRGLGPHFDLVIGTDASAEQLARARGADNVRFSVAPADACPVDDGTVDLLTAAQAAHWFDHERFHREAARVLKPSGVLAIWTYELVRVDPTIDREIDDLSHGTLGADWPPERAHVDAGYRTLPFPWPELVAPPLTIQLEWSLEDLLAYCESWSSLQRFRNRTGADPLPAFRERLASLWGPLCRTASWRLRIRAGRRP